MSEFKNYYILIHLNSFNIVFFNLFYILLSLIEIYYKIPNSLNSMHNLLNIYIIHYISPYIFNNVVNV